jgi:hypothetical protein
MQRFVRDHDMHGELALGISGILSLTGAAESALTTQLLLRDALVAFGDYILPVHSLETTARLERRAIHIDSLVVGSLGGTLQITGLLEPARSWAMDLNVDAQGLRIEESLRPASDGPPKYAGRVDLGGQVTGELTNLPHTVGGAGRLNITEGRLINDPIFGGLVRTVSGGTVDAAGNDRAESDLELVPGELRFRGIRMASGTIAARGDGELRFDGEVDFRFNAGQLERAQSLLGPLGEIMGKLTDKLVKYHVTGPVTEPTFTVKPLGFGAN